MFRNIRSVEDELVASSATAADLGGEVKSTSVCYRYTRKTSSSRSSASLKRAKAELELKQDQLEALHIQERILKHSAQASLEARL